MKEELMQTHTPTNAGVASLARLVNCMDESELAALAGVKHSTLNTWRKRGGGPDYVLLGCTYLYPIAAIQSFLTNKLRTRTVVDANMMLI